MTKFDDILLNDLELTERAVAEIKVAIDRFYYNASLADTVNKLLLSMMSQAAQFLLDGLVKIRQKYEKRLEA